jgi:HPt (histidine-containing phosphotransfer) domain-containing protein
VIALTANALKGDRDACLEAGMDGYVSKPLAVPALVEAIERVCRNRAGAGKPAREPAAEAVPVDIGPPAADAPINTVTLLERCMGKTDLALELLDRFAHQVSHMLGMLQDHLASGNAELFTRVSHTLKGSAGSMSAGAVREIAAGLEELGRRHSLEPARENLALLAREVQRCLEYVPRAKAQLEGNAARTSAPSGEINP